MVDANAGGSPSPPAGNRGERNPAGKKLQGLVRAYAQSLVGEEWPRMQEGTHAAGSEAAFVSLLTAILDAPVAGSSGAAVQRARLDIAMKLLAKLPEDRYEIAGLLVDTLGRQKV